MKRTWRVVRGTLIVVTTILLTTVVINATDNLGNLSNSLLGSVIGSPESNARCPKDMVFIASDTDGFCIDRYEASPGEDCLYGDPGNQEETRINLENTSCAAASVKGATPWRNIARHQAELACANAGKRLPVNKEWYRASLGTADTHGNLERGDCNLSNNTSNKPEQTGTRDKCVSSSGVFDMVGNVWEWVDGTVVYGLYEGRKLPEEGYVTSIDSTGVPVTTSVQIPDPNFNSDYAWIDDTETRGIIRGGYWRSGSDGGQYTINAITPPSFAGIGVGFRCAL